MVSMEWICKHCGHEVPIENLEVHELRCARSQQSHQAASPPVEAFGSRDNVSGSSWREVNLMGRHRDEEDSSRVVNNLSPRPASLNLVDSNAAEPRSEPGLVSSVEHTRSRQLEPSGTEIPIRRHSSRRQGSAAGGTHAAGGGSGSGAHVRQWSCPACTFDNPAEAPCCGMCGTRVPPLERPPDGRYRDTLIDDRTAGGSDWPMDDPDLATALQEAARCEEQERRGRANDTERWGAGDGSMHPTISDAATGSALGALSAGMLSALSSRNRPGRVMSSMVQGALVGGVAGVALGSELRRSPSTDGHRRSDLERPDESSTRFGAGAGAGADYAALQRLSQALDGLNQPRGPEGRDQTRRYRDRAPGIRRRVVYVPMEHLGSGGNRPASARSIAHLPDATLTAESLRRMPPDDRQCCICIEDFKEGDLITRLPCLHQYHANCISSWLRQSGTCPTCKHRVD